MYGKTSCEIVENRLRYAIRDDGDTCHCLHDSKFLPTRNDMPRIIIARS